MEGRLSRVRPTESPELISIVITHGERRAERARAPTHLSLPLPIPLPPRAILQSAGLPVRLARPACQCAFSPFSFLLCGIRVFEDNVFEEEDRKEDPARGRVGVSVV